MKGIRVEGISGHKSLRVQRNLAALHEFRCKQFHRDVPPQALCVEEAFLVLHFSVASLLEAGSLEPGLSDGSW